MLKDTEKKLHDRGKKVRKFLSLFHFVIYTCTSIFSFIFFYFFFFVLRHKMRLFLNYVILLVLMENISKIYYVHVIN